MDRPLHILACTDFSEAGNRAVAAAGRLFPAARTLAVLHAIEPPQPPNPLYAHYSSERAWSADDVARMEETSRTAMRELVAEVTARGIPKVELLVPFAPAVDAILRAADDLDADVIVLGTHGRSGLARLLLGSVAEHVVRTAKRSVLVVR